jgi:hypothetical protein
MTKEETKAFLKTIVSIYPDFKLTDYSVTAWQMCLAEMKPEACLAALKAHANESKWPPTVAELNAIIEQANRPLGSDWTAAEALSYVQNLASRYRKMSEQEKAQERLNCPKLTKQALKLVGFHRFLPHEPAPYNPWVTPSDPLPDPSGLFVKTYEQLKNREIDIRRLERLPETERKALEMVKEKVPALVKFLN